jgi:hypothetical protein
MLNTETINKSTYALSEIYHHKFTVLKIINPIIQDLIKRSEEHDNSKLTEDEFPDIIASSEELKKFPYGSPEYDEVRKKWQSGFEKHSKKNRHHIDHFENGIEGMTLVDLIELLADWKSATLRSPHPTNIWNAIRIGAEKYNIPPALIKILENTAKEYKM